MNILRCIVPIQRQVDRRRFEQFGSGTLLRIDKYHFLISAAHVVLNDQLWIFGEPQDIHLNDIEFHTTSPNLESVKDDEADIGFALLPQVVVERIAANGFEFLPLLRTAYRAPKNSSNRAAFSGFPCSKSKLRVSAQQMAVRPVFIESELLSAKELKQHGLDPAVRIAIRYDKDVQFDARTQTRTNGVQPDGMSGGPIWRFGPERVPWLAGIGTNYDPLKRILHGTRFDDVLTQLSQRIIADMTDSPS